MCYQKNNVDYAMQQLGKLTKHHRRPKSKGGKGTVDNISMVPNKLHEAYHTLFCNYSVQRQCQILNDHFIDPDYYVVPVPKEFLDTIFKILSKGRKQ